MIEVLYFYIRSVYCFILLLRWNSFTEFAKYA